MPTRAAVITRINTPIYAVGTVFARNLKLPFRGDLLWTEKTRSLQPLDPRRLYNVLHFSQNKGQNPSLEGSIESVE